MRKNMAIKRLLLASALTILPVAKNLVYAADESAQSTQGLSAERFAEIRAKINESLPKCSELKNKDITVILGNTGSGKSTFTNMFAKAPMKIDTKGNLLPSDGKGVAFVNSGFDSVTKFPNVISETDIGYFADLPGFEDTGGAVDDL